MKIAIHGTKHGYRIITPEQVAGLFDARPDVHKIETIGQQAYSIHFNRNNVVFSKYKIIRDGMGYLRTGNIAFSVIVPNNQKLSGAEVKALLDSLANYYCSRYIVEDTLNDVREDWTFVENIARDFTVKDVCEDDVESFQQGAADAAFVYYSSDAELQKYFDAPYQDKYSEFKQIFFVKSDLEYKLENPLNALQHSNRDLTKIIDLENLSYRLRNYNGQGENGVVIEIHANDRIRNNNDKIFKKDNISIKYSKDKYYENIYEEGKITDTNITQYLTIDESSGKIDVKKDVNLKPVTKIVFFEINDYEGTPVNGAEIKIGIQVWQKINGSLYQHIFKGEELKEQQTVLARKESENLLSERVKVLPEQQQDVIKLNLQKQKVVKISAFDKENNDNISNFKLWINDNKGYRENITEWIFKGDDIEKTWIIEISKKEGQNNYSGKKNYCPATGKKDINIPLQRTEKPPSKFKNYYEYKNYSFFKKLLDRPKLYASIGTAIIALGLGIWILCSWLRTDNSQQLSKQVKSYVEDDRLVLGELENYRRKWNDQKPKKHWYDIFPFSQTDTNKAKKWSNILQYIDNAINKRNLINSANFAELKKYQYSPKQKKFKDAVERIDSTQYEYVKQQLGDVSTLTLTEIAENINSIITIHTSNPYQEIIDYLGGNELEKEALTQYRKKTNDNNLIQLINQCIDFRTNLNQGDIDKLKNSNYKYSNAQQALKTALDAINEENKSYISKEMYKAPISKMNLDEIAELIHQTIDEYNKTKEEYVIPQPEKPDASVKQETVSTDKASEIIQYLKGSELKKSELENYKNQTANNELKKSIDLALKFWSLNGQRNNSYSSYQIELEKDNNLNRSDLNRLVDIMCGKERPKYVVELPQSDHAKKLNQLKDKLQ
jgi:hypothetical protein